MLVMSGCLWLIKRRRRLSVSFLADKMAFWAIATVWGILEQLIAEPLFHPLHIPSVLQILLRTSSCGMLAFQKDNFSVIFWPMFKEKHSLVSKLSWLNFTLKMSG
jgi:hypothetical protein